MATKAKPKATIETNGKVTVTIPRAREGEEKSLYICVNGKSYLIPKGKPVEVPDYIAKELERSQEAENRMYEEKERLLAQSNL